ncbi:MAG: glycosyltransferase family 39 protein, partial [Oscillospiraceae bacterium]|nr:glycosyltransferase family 39 protein [Oscillospiraceae bacterium]
MPMFEISKYFLPAACFLLIAVFFMLLPDLRSCRLEGGERRMDRTDLLLIAAMTLVYAAAAFLGLGNTDSPQSFVPMENETVELALDPNGEEAAKLMIYTGVGIGSYSIDYTAEDGRDIHLSDMEQSHADVLKWHELSLERTVTGGALRISGRGGVWLGEVVALTADGQRISLSSDMPELADEQGLCPTRQTFMNSSYFDEIYHARTAWEQLNGVYPYEITHPPLGKTIIGLGIRLFGMTPFGWRFSGTLFGVLMLPILYYFAKKLFGGRAAPAACTLLMATDFMHFVQTRIATIDTYAVFFILLMYLFMYLFVTEGRLRDLALCGISFGLGAASKWTCFYAGAGLAVIWAIWVIREARAGRLDFLGFAKNALFCVGFFVLAPCLIYYLSYIPYGVARGIRNVFSRDY